MSFAGVRPDDVGYALSLGKEVGTAWLSAKYEHITEEELNRIGEMAKNKFSKRPKQPFESPERKFQAALWLIGASQSVIASAYGLAQQTISNKLDREFDQLDRWKLRLVNTDRRTKESLPLERVVQLREDFEQLLHKKPGTLDGYSCVEIAAMLLKLPEPLPDDPYAATVALQQEKTQLREAIANEQPPDPDEDVMDPEGNVPEVVKETL